MPSDVEICNLSLSLIGSGVQIASFTENSNEVEACDQFYEVSLKEMLREFPWAFAKKRVTLGLVDEDPVDYDEWSYSYRYPSDCIFARRLDSGLPVDKAGTRLDFDLAQDDEGLLLLCNVEDAVLEYTYYASDASRFPADFVMALAYRIACYVAPRLIKDPTRVAAVIQAMYDKSISKARKANSNEIKHTVSESEFIDGR